MGPTEARGAEARRLWELVRTAGRVPAHCWYYRYYWRCYCWQRYSRRGKCRHCEGNAGRTRELWFLTHLHVGFLRFFIRFVDIVVEHCTSSTPIYAL